MTEQFNERTAGIWFPLVFYVASGVFLLAFWGLFARSTFELLVLGVVSFVIAGACFMMSRWAFWVGLFTFPLFFVEFLYSIWQSVNFVGWDPNPQTLVFQASMIVYLVFLTLSVIMLLDKRNTLKGDRVLDLLNRPVASEDSKSS